MSSKLTFKSSRRKTQRSGGGSLFHARGPAAVTFVYSVETSRYLQKKNFTIGYSHVILVFPYRTIGDRAFGAVAPRVWNDLPADIVSAPSLAIFKRRLKTYLFGQSFG